jgi:hypothetical protein
VCSLTGGNKRSQAVQREVPAARQTGAVKTGTRLRRTAKMSRITTPKGASATCG